MMEYFRAATAAAERPPGNKLTAEVLVRRFDCSCAIAVVAGLSLIVLSVWYLWITFGWFWESFRPLWIAGGLTLVVFDGAFCLLTIIANRRAHRPVFQFSLEKMLIAMALSLPLVYLNTIHFDIAQTSAPLTWYAGFPLPCEFSTPHEFWISALLFNVAVLVVHIFCMLFLLSEVSALPDPPIINSDKDIKYD